MMDASAPLPTVPPHRVARAGASERVAVRARLSAGLAVAVGTGAFITVTTADPVRYRFDSAWIAGVCTVLAVDAVRLRGDQPPGHLQLLVWSMPIAAMVGTLWSVGLDVLGPWEWISAWLAVAIAWSLARSTPARLRRTLQRLDDRQVLGEDGNGAGELSRDLDRIAHRWALAGGGCIVVAFAVPLTWALVRFGFLSHVSLQGIGWLAAFVIPAFLGAFAAGAWIGRMGAYGRLGAQLRGLHLRLRVIPGHPDGAGGLRPLGAFFLRQSLVAAVPAAYLVVWLVLETVSSGEGLAHLFNWSAAPDWWLVAVAILAEILTFVAPMRSIHSSMRAEKQGELWRESDRISRQIEEIRNRLSEANVSDRRDQEGQLAAMIGRFEALEATPTWPIDTAIRRRFTLQNVGLLLPFVGYAVGETSFLDRLSKLFTGLQ
jgi:hypothetical protein